MYDMNEKHLELRVHMVTGDVIAGEYVAHVGSDIPLNTQRDLITDYIGELLSDDAVLILDTTYGLTSRANSRVFLRIEHITHLEIVV